MYVHICPELEDASVKSAGADGSWFGNLLYSVLKPHRNTDP